jgi:predicted Zn-dependent protease
MCAPLERAIELQMDNYAAHLNLAYAYTAAGQPDKARREAQWCLARNPNDVAARRFLAQAARDEGQFDEAQREVQLALALAPEDLDIRMLEAEILLYQKQPERALQRLKPLYQAFSQDRRLVALLARAAAAAGLADEAASYRQQVQKLSQ